MIVRLKGIKIARAKGRTYYYHRRTMTRLPGMPGSAEFVAKLRELRELDRRQPGAGLPGSLGALIKLYRASPEYTTLAPRSREIYQTVFDRLQPLDGMPLAQIDSEFLYALRDRIPKWSVANQTIKVLRMVFGWGQRRGKMRDNPAEHVDTIRRPRDLPKRNRPWNAEEIERVLSLAPPWLQVPIALAAYTGLRKSDVASVRWSAYNGQAVEVRMQKTGRIVWIPAHSRLREILDGTPRHAVTIVTGASGRPTTAHVLGVAFRKLLLRHGIEGLTFHGLRHTVGTAIIEAGGSRAMAQAILGHDTERSSEGYSKTADRHRLATEAIRLLENGMENRAPTG